MNKNENIMWYSLADGSYGGCERQDLIIVKMDDFTDEDWAAMEAAGNDKDVMKVYLAVQNRMANNES